MGNFELSLGTGFIGALVIPGSKGLVLARPGWLPENPLAVQYQSRLPGADAARLGYGHNVVLLVPQVGREKALPVVPRERKEKTEVGTTGTGREESYLQLTKQATRQVPRTIY